MTVRFIPVLFLVAAVSAAGGVFAGRSSAHAAALDGRRLEQSLGRLDRRLQQIEESGAGPPCTGSAVAFAVDSPALRGEIRQVLAEELRATLAGVRGGRDPGGSSGAAAQAAEEMRIAQARSAALDRGHELLDGARSTRTWSAQQAQEMRSLLPDLSDEQRTALVDELLGAVRSGDLTAEGPPF